MCLVSDDGRRPVREFRLKRVDKMVDRNYADMNAVVSWILHCPTDLLERKRTTLATLPHMKHVPVRILVFSYIVGRHIQTLRKTHP